MVNLKENILLYNLDTLQTKKKKIEHERDIGNSAN